MNALPKTASTKACNGAIPSTPFREAAACPALVSAHGGWANTVGRRDECRLIRAAIEHGVTLIDTAEMYGEGGAEAVINRALSDVAIASYCIWKQGLPQRIRKRGTIAACERSLKRLGTDYPIAICHWRGSIRSPTPSRRRNAEDAGENCAWASLILIPLTCTVCRRRGWRGHQSGALQPRSSRRWEFALLPCTGGERGIPDHAFTQTIGSHGCWSRTK